MRVLKITGLVIAGIFGFLIILGSIVGPQHQPEAEPSVMANDTALKENLEENQTVPVSPKPPAEEVKPAVKPTPPAAKPQPSTPPPAVQPSLFKVVSVVDGDTIKVSIDGVTQTLRLIGMDTPETVDPRKPVQCFGKEASDKAKATLNGKMVRLEADSTQGNTDKYQRLLRYVFLEDGTFFNKMMIAEGYAHEYTYDLPYKYQAEFKLAEKTARESQLGLWSPNTCNGNTESPSSAQSAQPEQPSGHTFYLSSYYTAKYYYCDTDDVWKSLSEKYLESYSSESDLLKAHPGRTLHEPCK